jgi:hypothetical protein
VASESLSVDARRPAAFPRSPGSTGTEPARLLTRAFSRAIEGGLRTLRRTRSTTAFTLVEAVALLVALVLIQVVVFRGYYTGVASPAGDFLGLYSNEPAAWWRDGGIIDPPDWMPYVWGGYPAVASIQNSSWYLPVGLATVFGFDIHAAAVVQALQVAAAGLGAYALGRRAGFGRVASLFGLVAYSFSTGFYSNAPYVDIVRGHALAPWILLCLSPLWPWKRWWSVPVAAVVFWQAAVGVYPGMLMAFAYGGAAWALAWQIGCRTPLRRFVLPAAAAGLIGVLLAMPKYLPLVTLRTFKPGDVEDLSVLARSTLGTFVLPEFPGLPGLYSMNSFFLPVTAILLLAFARYRSPAVRAALAALAVALFLSVPQLPFRDFVDMLPGIGTSRFRLNDFRPFVLLPLVVAAMSGLARMLDARPERATSLRSMARLLILGLVPASAAAFVLVGRFHEGNWRPTAAVLVVATAVVAGHCAFSGRWSPSRHRLVAVVLIGLTAASGLTYVRTVRDLWAVDSAAAQQALWGTSSAELIQHHVDLSDAVRRVARSAIVQGADPAEMISTSYNSGYYTGLPSVGGYLNVQMSASFVEARRALADPATASAARALLEAPGIVIGWTGDLPQPAAVDECVRSNDCNGVTATPVAYAVDELVYDVQARTPMLVLVNEAYYVGWSALLLDESGRATAVEPTLGPAGMIALAVPEGSWQLSLSYDTPLEGPARALGAAGLGLLVGVPVLGFRHSRRRAGETADAS